MRSSILYVSKDQEEKLNNRNYLNETLLLEIKVLMPSKKTAIETFNKSAMFCQTVMSGMD